jgi:predicted alpha/beta-fold hydrolase
MTVAQLFDPPRVLRAAHVQTSLSSLPPRRWFTARRARSLRGTALPWIIDLGQLGRLRALVSPARGGSGARGVAVLLHGWEGNADSTYVLSLGAELYDAGYEVVRLNLRDHGGTQALTRELFHSCRLPEVVAAVRQIAARYAQWPVQLAGFSLGGNFFLRVAAEPDLPGNLQRVVAVSPVLHPESALRALELGPSLYHSYFVLRWSRSLRAKQRSWPQDFDFAQLLKLRDLRAMTAALVREHTDFATMQDYLDGYAITGDRLRRLQVPAHLLCAADDPIIPAADLQRLNAHPLLEVTSLAHGGHCGFVQRLNGPSFADHYVLRRFGLPATASNSASSRA